MSFVNRSFHSLQYGFVRFEPVWLLAQPNCAKSALSLTDLGKLRSLARVRFVSEPPLSSRQSREESSGSSPNLTLVYADLCPIT